MEILILQHTDFLLKESAYVISKIFEVNYLYFTCAGYFTFLWIKQILFNLI